MDDIQDEYRSNAPAEVYGERLQTLRASQAKEQRRSTNLGFAKLALAIVTVVLGLSLLHHPAALTLLLVPTIAFLTLAVVHERTFRSLRTRTRAIDFYTRGLERLDDQWAGSGENGDRFLDPLHPYARDLDIFGEASLFELLCTARTRAGEATLAAWLLGGATVDEVRSRQAAVNELKHRIQFREGLWSLGETVRLGVQPELLSAWGERGPTLGSRSIRVLTVALALLWLTGLVCWAVWGARSLALVMTVVNLGYSHHLHKRLDEAADSIEKATGDLALLAEMLAFLERQNFASTQLREVQAALNRAAIPPSDAIKKLRRITESLESRRNPFARMLDIFTFWSAQLVFASESWQQRFGVAIRGWLMALGELEALVALSGFAYEHPNYVFPDFIKDGPLFDAEGFAHPLLSSREAVRNNLKLGDGLDLIILSGPNMAGKSTFIRSIGVNVVLAQCGAPVCARRLTLSPLAVGASICILDSLKGGTSRFYAEIGRIKLISVLTRGPVPVLFLLDELLSGTNSHDRLAGTQYLVAALMEEGAIGIVSTHDLALTRIPEEIGARAVNCHFEDRLENGKLFFDYTLKPGVVQTSNALELMRSIGLGVKK